MTGIPIVCLGCNERAEIPFIPPDLTCVACKTGEHIDFDDADIRTEAAGDSIYCGACRGQGVRNAGGAWVNCTKCKGTGIAKKPRQQIDKDLGKDFLGDHVGAKDAALGEPDLPMMLLPSGTPDQDQDVELLRESDEKRKVTVPQGSAPYSQRALAALTKSADLGSIRNLLAQFNGKNVTVTYDDDLGLHTVAGPLTYHPPTVVVGQSNTTDVHVLQLTVNGYGDFPDQRTEPVGASAFTFLQNFPSGATATKTASEPFPGEKVCPNCNGTGQRQDDPEMKTVDGRCAMCGGKGAIRKNIRERNAVHKIDQIQAAVLQSNPGMDSQAARKVAIATVARYPKVASGA